jgi:hypothetical protein
VAQVSFVAAGAQAANTNGSVTPALPAGITDGDLLLVVVATAAPARTFTAPAGWSTTTYATNSQANGPRLAFAWKSYVTGDTAPLMTAGGTGVAGSGVVGKVLAYRNADTTAGPTFGTAYSSGATTGTTTGTIGGVAVTGLGLALLIGVWDNSKSTTATAAGWTLDTDASGTAATVNVSWAVLEEAVSSSSSAGTAIVGHPTAAATMAGIQIGLNSTDEARGRVVGLRPRCQLRPDQGPADHGRADRRPAHGPGQGPADHALHLGRLDGLQPGYGIAVYRTGRQVFSGPVSSRTLTWDPESGAATIRVEAVGDEVVLADRLAMPDPLRAADDQTVNDYWTYTGVASTAMRQLISDQAGATCAASRQVSGLTLGGTTPTSGPRAPGRACSTRARPAGHHGGGVGLGPGRAGGLLDRRAGGHRGRPAQPRRHGHLLGRPVQPGRVHVHRDRPDGGQRPGGRAGRPAPADPQGRGRADTGTTRWARQAWSYVDRRDTNDADRADQRGHRRAGQAARPVSRWP